MKLQGVLVDILEKIAPEVCSQFVTCQNDKKVLRASMLKPSHGTLKASLLYCQQFASDIEKIGCITNSHNACVANKIINNKQHALAWHADDAKSSHADPKVNDNFEK